MKILKNIFTIILLFFVFLLNAAAQEKQNLDEQPEPIGGIEGIAKNIVYPEKAKQEKIQGMVMLKVEINEKGEVGNIYIERGVDKLLDEAAIKAVKATKFTPGILNGKKVKAEVLIPIRFKLDDCKKT